MPTREQLTHERIDALISRLEDSAVIDADTAEALRSTRNFEQAEEAVKYKRNGKDPREAPGRNG